MRHKIIKSNRFIHGIRRSAAEEAKAILLRRLVDALREQIKPSLSVFILGGVDVLFNLVFVTILVSVAHYLPQANILVLEFVLVPLRFFQTL